VKKAFVYLLFCASTILSAQEKKIGTAYMVSNAHLDTQWDWTVQRTIYPYIYNTMVQNMWLLDNYPEFVCNFEGAVKYSWMKEYYPETFEKIKPYIASGRWHVSGSSWDATDVTIPSTESLFKNILLGQEFYKREFGLKSTDIFLPDCFSFGYTLPTVAAHCDLIGFSAMRVWKRNQPFYDDGRRAPFPFGLWQGIDGSQILAALEPGRAIAPTLPSGHPDGATLVPQGPGAPVGGAQSACPDRPADTGSPVGGAKSGVPLIESVTMGSRGSRARNPASWSS